MRFVARTSGVEGAGTGHDAVRSWWKDNHEALEDLHVELERVIDGGDWVVSKGISHIRGGQSGVALNVPFAQPVEYRDGKVVTFESFHTLSEALEAASLTENEAMGQADSAGGASRTAPFKAIRCSWDSMRRQGLDRCKE